METKWGQVDLLNVSDYAEQQYRNFTRNSKNLSSETIRKKLHRDFIIGCHIATYPDGTQLRAYGNLYLYEKDYEIIKIGCCGGRCKAYVYINTREKKNLNLLLGIGGDR